MIQQLRIQNFKCWQDTGTIHMAPLTLFFGVNSSGKSSIGQFLMMLKQTVESPDRKAVFYPGDRNSAVQLGSYKEMVLHRDPNNKIIFEYRWTVPELLRIKDPLSNEEFFGDTILFSAEVGLLGREDQNPVIHEINYDLFYKTKRELSIVMERKADTKSEYKVEASHYKLKRKQGRVWYPGAPVRFYGFPDEVVAYHQNADFVQELNLFHEKLFRSLYYLGPLRTKAERLYSWTGIQPDSVGNQGENTIAAILAARHRKISLGYRQKARPFEEIIASKLKDMGLIEDFKVNPISKQRHEYEVKVRTKGSPDWVDLPDVGFGISQVLPVLVQCFYAPRGSIIIMEQPEIHLHPSAQSALADVMIDAIHSRENGKDRSIQLIIETHSEHFLRRLQRRIAENALPQEHVSAYFADIGTMPAKLKSLQIDEYGNIQNWPENFFGDDVGDIVAQSEAAMKKQRERTSQLEASE